MALRNLVTRMRTPAAAALRLPSVPRVSPAAGSRRFSTPPCQGEQHGKRILNFESASEEEILREAASLEKQIDEAWELVRKDMQEKMPRILQDIYGTAKLFIGASIIIELLSLATSRRRTTVEPKE